MKELIPTNLEHQLAGEGIELQVGPYTYIARLVPGQLFHEGVECSAATLETTREILIASDGPKRDVLRLLIHEYARAWEFAVGVPVHQDEVRCFITAICISFMQQCPPAWCETSIAA